MVASSSGVGGGGLFVPILLLVGRFTPHLATALSSVIIFGSSISNLIIALFQKHPNTDRPMIDYDVSLLMTPTVLVGTILGVLLNVMFPNWLILLLLLVLLGFTTIRTFQKGIKEYREESKALLEAEKQQEMNEHNKTEKHEEVQQFLNDDLERSHNEIDIHQLEPPIEVKKEKQIHEEVKTPELKEVEMKTPETKVYYHDDVETHENEHFHTEGDLNNLDFHEKSLEYELSQVLKSEARRCPPLQWILLAFCWVVLFLSSILKGGKKFPSIIPGIEPCGIWYWVIEFCVLPILLGISILYGIYLRRRYQYKVLIGYKFLKGDIHWTLKNSIVIPMICLSAGILAGLLGLGGGMVIGPVFLELGVLTQVAANTSSFIIVRFVHFLNFLVFNCFINSCSIYIFGSVTLGLFSLVCILWVYFCFNWTIFNHSIDKKIQKDIFCCDITFCYNFYFNSINVNCWSL